MTDCMHPLLGRRIEVVSLLRFEFVEQRRRVDWYFPLVWSLVCIIVLPSTKSFLDVVFG